jgi:hypothetical protein
MDDNRDKDGNRETEPSSTDCSIPIANALYLSLNVLGECSQIFHMATQGFARPAETGTLKWTPILGQQIGLDKV